MQFCSHVESSTSRHKRWPFYSHYGRCTDQCVSLLTKGNVAVLLKELQRQCTRRFGEVTVFYRGSVEPKLEKDRLNFCAVL